MWNNQGNQPAQMNADTPRRNENNEQLMNEDDQTQRPSFMFSVEYILNKAGEKKPEDDMAKPKSPNYDWLYCTRFKPPKLDSTYKYV